MSELRFTVGTPFFERALAQANLILEALENIGEQDHKNNYYTQNLAPGVDLTHPFLYALGEVLVYTELPRFPHSRRLIEVMYRLGSQLGQAIRSQDLGDDCWEDESTFRWKLETLAKALNRLVLLEFQTSIYVRHATPTEVAFVNAHEHTYV